MQEEAIYEELQTTKDITAHPRLSNMFHLTTDHFDSDKVQASLYEKFILLKFKVHQALFRNKTKSIYGRYLSISTWFLSCYEKNQRIKNWESHMDFALNDFKKV